MAGFKRVDRAQVEQTGTIGCRETDSAADERRAAALVIEDARVRFHGRLPLQHYPPQLVVIDSLGRGPLDEVEEPAPIGHPLQRCRLLPLSDGDGKAPTEEGTVLVPVTGTEGIPTVSSSGGPHTLAPIMPRCRFLAPFVSFLKR